MYIYIYIITRVDLHYLLLIIIITIALILFLEFCNYCNNNNNYLLEAKKSVRRPSGHNLLELQ